MKSVLPLNSGLVASLVFSTGGMAQNPDPLNAFDIFKNGMALEKELKIFEARDHYLRAIQADPENTGYLEHYAWFLHGHSFHEEAASVFPSLLGKAQDKAAVYKALAFNQKQIGLMQQALDSYSQVYTWEPGLSMKEAFPEISGKIHAETEQKIRQTKAILAINPFDTSMHEELINLHLSRGEFAEARVIAENLLPKHQGDLPFRLKYARILYWGGRREEAEREFSNLLREHPGGYLQFALAEVQHSLGNLDEAEKNLRAAHSLHPDSPRIRKELAEVLAKKRRTAAAVAIAPHPGEPGGQTLTGRLARARAYHFSGDLKEAIPIYEGILEDYPQNQEAFDGLTECLIYNARFATAGHLLEEWKKISTDDRIDRRLALLETYTGPRLGLQMGGYRNSSDFERMDAGISLGFHPNLKTRISAGYTISEFQQEGFNDISRHQIYAEGEYRPVESFGLGGRLAGNFYDNSQSHLNGRVSIYLNPSTKFAASLDFEHLDMIDLEPPFGNQIFSHSLSIGSVGRKIASDTASLFMRVQPVDRVDILGKISYGDLSDGNQRLSWFGEIDYTLLKKPLLQAGYSYYYLHYSDPAAIYTEGARAIPAYYDPKNFEAHTVKVKLIHDFSPQWQFGIEQRFSHVPKSDGFATGTFAFLNYSFDEKNSIRLDGRYFYQSRGVNRNGLGPSFDAAAFTLSYQLRF